MNCLPVKKHVIEKGNESCLERGGRSLFQNKPVAVTKNRKRRPGKFDLEHVCSEWRERAPVFYSFLLKSAASKSSKSST